MDTQKFIFKKMEKSMSYSIKEIIDIAIGLEKSGYEFYTKCEKKFDDKDVKKIFSFLADEELKHKESFENISVNDGTPSGVFTDDYYLYLKAIGGSRVFLKNENIDMFLDSISSAADAIKKAFLDEKESILFYNEIKNLYEPGSNAINLINIIINEERNHVVKLTELMEKLNPLKP